MRLVKRKPRNHLVLTLLKRQGGAGLHEKSFKAKRRADKVKLSRDFLGGVV